MPDPVLECNSLCIHPPRHLPLCPLFTRVLLALADYKSKMKVLLDSVTFSAAHRDTDRERNFDVLLAMAVRVREFI